jgi:hypothetical protein
MFYLFYPKKKNLFFLIIPTSQSLLYRGFINALRSDIKLTSFLIEKIRLSTENADPHGRS